MKRHPVTLEPVRVTGHVVINGSFKITVTKGDQRIDGTMSPEDALCISEIIAKHVRRNKRTGEIEFSFDGFRD